MLRTVGKKGHVLNAAIMFFGIQFPNVFPNGSAIPALIYLISLSSPQLLQTRPYALMNGLLSKKCFE
jgi:hypothetical protein